MVYIYITLYVYKPQVSKIPERVLCIGIAVWVFVEIRPPFLQLFIEWGWVWCSGRRERGGFGSRGLYTQPINAKNVTKALVCRMCFWSVDIYIWFGFCGV